MEIIQTLLLDKSNRHKDGQLHEYSDVDHIPFRIRDPHTANMYVAWSDWWKKSDKQLLFSLDRLRSNVKLLNDLNFTYNGFIVAGGWLTQTDTKSDIDIFIYGDNHESVLAEITKHLGEYDYQFSRRTKYYVLLEKIEATRRNPNPFRNPAMKNFKNPIQIILRQYQSIAEILYGFDVGSSQIGYNGISLLSNNLFHIVFFIHNSFSY